MTGGGEEVNMGAFLLLWKTVLMSPVIRMVLLVYILTPGGVLSIREKNQ